MRFGPFYRWARMTTSSFGSVVHRVEDPRFLRGKALQETVELVRQLGTRVIGCGVIVRFRNSSPRLEAPGQDPVPILSLVDFDAKWYESGQACKECKQGSPEEHVRF